VLSFGDHRIDLTRPWQRVTVKEAVVTLGGVEETVLADEASLRDALAKRHIQAPAGAGYGKLLMSLFEETVEERLIQPTFITEFPTEVSPLAKQKLDDPAFTERFELYLGGMEIANAFSELNDPDTQAARFRQQLAARDAGDDEAHRFDHDYVRALEYGMPPAGGEGIGIDRLVMLLANQPSIRDVILFPLLRPEVVSDRPEADQQGADDQPSTDRAGTAPANQDETS
jgi:lysyl-tRNA synthetase class 2